MNQKTNKNARQLAEWLDSKFTIPNTNIRYGLDPLIGLLPGIGDWIGGAVSMYYLVMVAVKGGKASVMSRVFLNIMLDVVTGSIPVLGEFFDVYWKANIRNAQILEELEQDLEKTTTESRFWIWMVLIQFIAAIIATLVLIGWILFKIFELLF